MSSDYNEKVAKWTLPSILSTVPHLEQAIHAMRDKNPERFAKGASPFIIAEYGVATGRCSVPTLKAII